MQTEVVTPLTFPRHTPSQSEWVKPAQPTTLDGCLYMPLRGIDQIFSSIEAVWIVPGLVDTEKLKQAISLTLALYPHAAGRLKQSTQGQWHVRLSKSPVPVNFVTSRTTPTEKMLREGHSELFDRIPWGDRPPQDAERHPLTRFKVIWFECTGETAVVLHICHALADGLTCARLMTTVSDYYQNTPISVPIPTFEKFFSEPPTLSPAENAEAPRLVPNLINDYDPRTHSQMCREMIARTSRVDIRFSSEQLRLLQIAATTSSNSRISRGDALIAYLFTLMNRVYPVKFNRLMNLVEFRGRKGPTDDEYQVPTFSAAGNVLFHSVFDEIPASELLDFGKMAVIVRNTIAKTHEFRFLKTCVGFTERRSAEISAAGHLPWNLPTGRTLSASLIHKAGVHNAHFGYPGMVRVYTYPALEHYFRVMAANPTRHEDGTYTGNEGGVDVFFRVRKEHKEQVLRTVKRDVEALLEKQSAPARL